MIEARVICDSINEQGNRLTTFKLKYPKFIHGEFMTHRVFSRNASSSRAVPTAKLLEEVRSDELRAAPIFWGKNQKGMQAAEELEEFTAGEARLVWMWAAHHAANSAELLVLLGAHKQIVNRILEPFTHINVIVTATEWQNFFGLRLHKDAQPEMRALAIAMWEGMEVSIPKPLKPGQWHTPYADDDETLNDILAYTNLNFKPVELILETRIKISVARCGRTSYESFETGKRSTIEENLGLYDRLLGSQPIHASPAEHQATPDSLTHENSSPKSWFRPEQHGNFVGWRQFRKTLTGEALAPIPAEFGGRREE